MLRSVIPLFLCLLLALAGCAPRATGDTDSGRLPELLPPEVSLTAGTAAVTSFDPPGAGARVALSVPVTISNPNNFPVHVRSLEFSYGLGEPGQSVQGVPLGDVISLLPGGSRQVELQLEQSLLGNAELLEEVAATFGGDALGFSIRLDAGYSSARHTWLSNQEYRLSGTARAAGSVELPVLELPAGGSSAYSVESGFPVVKVIMHVSNPGGVGYLLHAKDLMLELAGQPVAEIDLRPSPVPGFSSGQVELAFTPSAEQLSPEARSALSDALAGSPTEVTVRGQLALDVLGLGTFELPAGMQLTTLINAD